MTIDLTENEKEVVITVLRGTIEALDEMMNEAPTREIADQSNTLMDVVDKLEAKDVQPEAGSAGPENPNLS